MPEPRSIWTPAEAWAWQARQPWRLGCNYVPATAINSLEMWQAATFDPATVERELGWAAALGMNCVRVYLHDLLWRGEDDGFAARIDRFLGIADGHGLATMFVLFDSCWDPYPRLGPQPEPVPGVHNSGWVQSPGRAALEDPAQHPRLRAYVTGVVGRFAADPRVFAWDVWNEPDSPVGPAYPNHEAKSAEVGALLGPVFDWARSQGPSQPLTSPLYRPGPWAPGETTTIEAIQIAESDILTFHDYRWPEDLAARIAELAVYGRPVLCSEYLARSAGSTFDGALPVGKAADVGMINWGLVAGWTQTIYPWDSWEQPQSGRAPLVWFHDILRADGTPYRPAEAAMLKAFAAAPTGTVPRY